VNSRSIFELLFSSILAAVAIFSLVPSVRDFFRKWSNASWPSIDATVQRGQVGQGGPTRYAALVSLSIGYVYSVGSNQYVGTFVLVLGSEERAYEVQRRLKGACIKFRYDPKCPETSIVQSLPKEFADLVVNQDPEWVNYDGNELIDLDL
jgi:hypothetical protein